MSRSPSTSILISLCLAAGCSSLEQPELPFTGTSSASTVTEGSAGLPSPPPPSSSGIAEENGVGPPTIVSPLPGATFTDAQPTLTVENATSLSGPLTYEFQVSTNDSFGDVVAEVQSQPPGSSGTTSWQVEPALPASRYFWRGRGVSAAGAGPYSPISDFAIVSGIPTPSPPPSSGEIFDPLTNGSSRGQVSGGRFTSSGWQVTSRGDFIRYVVTPIRSGFVEWENIGLTRRNPQPDLFSLFGMWDPTRGDYRENPYRVHVRKLDTNGHNPPYLRLRFISNGDQRDAGYDFLDWDSSRVYRFRVEWGPSGSGNEARVLLDNRVVIRTGYGPAYRPAEHWIELGIEERAESIVGVVYRNVVIGRD